MGHQKRIIEYNMFKKPTRFEKQFAKQLEWLANELEKNARKQRQKAVSHLKKKLAQKIEGLPFKNSYGALAAGIDKQAYMGTTLIGMTAPHGFLVEFGTNERVGLKGDSRYRKRRFGRMTAIPFFMETYREELPTLGNILSEEWL